MGHVEVQYTIITYSKTELMWRLPCFPFSFQFPASVHKADMDKGMCVYVQCPQNRSERFWAKQKLVTAVYTFLLGGQLQPICLMLLSVSLDGFSTLICKTELDYLWNRNTAVLFYNQLSAHGELTLFAHMLNR